MSLGLVGHKVGMTRIFTEDGVSIPVTVVEMTAHHITQVLTQKRQGYSAVQMTTGAVKQSKVKKSRAGVYTKAGIPAGKFLFENRLDNTEGYKAGQAIPLSDVFFEGQYVDVTGTSKGKGFQGCVKRHNFTMQDATHGNSLAHRAPGSIGQCQTPGRVFKGKKMAGHMGDRRCTVQNQKVVRVDAEKNILLISGTIPGAPGGKVIIRASMKKAHKNEAAKVEAAKVGEA
jgi:large subunit ribosomal protein L3